MLSLICGSADSLAENRLDHPIVFTQVPQKNLAADTKPAADWMVGAQVVVLSPQGQVTRLSSGFHSACDPDVSWDGRKIVFAAQKDAGSPWAIYEIDADGSKLRQLHQGSRDCRTPVYLGSLFTLDSPEPWFTVLYTVRESHPAATGPGHAWTLFSVKQDGTEERRLTANPVACFDPVQMWDGRVIYAAGRMPDAHGRSRQSLFSLQIDGLEQELYGAEQGLAYQRMPCPLPNGRVLFVESPTRTADGAGQLACVKERRPHNSYEALTKDPAWVWLYPAVWDQDRALVSRRAADGSDTSALHLFNPLTGSSEPVFDDPGFHDIQAKGIKPRPVPDGRSTVVDTKYTTGKIFGLSCYIADSTMQPHLSTGTVQRVRLLEAVPDSLNASGENIRVTHRMLGEAPVESDGSFHIELPADIPVQLQTVDKDGLALATGGWFWVKPKENRGCIGCHEDPELMPESVFPKALARPANRLTLPPALRRSVAFQEDVLPILRKNCATAECHGSTETPIQLGGENAMARAIYEKLTAPRSGAVGSFVVPGQARTSPLVWSVLGKNTARPWDASADNKARIHQMPPPEKAAALSPAEVRVLTEWIDFGARWSTAASENITAKKP